MKKILFTICSISLLMGCSLEQKNQEEISGDGIINNIPKAYNVLSQAYLNLPVSNESFTLLSDDVQPSYLINFNPSLKLYYGWQAQEIKTSTAQIWYSYYKALAHVNAVLKTEQYINPKTSEWDYIKGNAMVLKAYIYFDLLQLFSKRYTPDALGIIPKNNIQIENNKRLTQQESIDIIKKLLIEGMDLMKNQKKQYNYMITTAAAQNLKAQVYLFTKEYDQAEKVARQLVLEYPKLPNTEEDYGAIWDTQFTKQANSVFWIKSSTENPNRYLYQEKDKGDFLYLNHLISFSPNDIRYNRSQYLYKMNSSNNDGLKQDRFYLGKYKREHTDHSMRNIVLSRNTESYFILIESLIEQGRLGEATNYLNDFLDSVNEEKIEINQSMSSLRLIMQKQKQKEFIGEKINFFDLKRWNLSSIRYLPDSNNKLSTISKTDYRWTWPIPNSELRYNPNAIQNEEWESIK